MTTAAGGPAVLDGLDAVREAVGRELGASEWITVTTERVARYVEATGDAPAPGETSVPPLLLVALTNMFLPQVVEVRGVSAGLNVGTGAVHFSASAPVGAQIRARVEVAAADEVTGGVQTTMRITVEARGSAESAVEGGARPVVVVDALSRWLA